MKLGLAGKRVFVSGSTQGIGLKIAESFLDEGARVMLNGHRKERLEKIEQLLLQRYPENVFSTCADLTTSTGAEQVARDIEHTFSELDIYIANLGNGKPQSSNYLELGDWERFYRINVLGNVALLDKLHFLLKKGQEPNVVMISSIVAKEKAAAPYGYAAAKGAITTLTRYLSKDWAQDGIRVNCVLPGNIYFPGGRWQELASSDEKAVRAYIDSQVPMRRFGCPEEVADTVLFLASNRAGFITGAMLPVDGGQLSGT